VRGVPQLAASQHNVFSRERDLHTAIFVGALKLVDGVIGLLALNGSINLFD